MSASLVGSEMCIRDSSKGGVASWDAVVDDAQVVRGCATSRARQRSSAVSYTHLTLPTICSV
eukprot:15238439-Alexandrium_andersonii.AAC.1